MQIAVECIAGGGLVIKGSPLARSNFKFFYTLRVRYAEVDAQGVVFNAHYLTYFDVGHTEYMRTSGYDYAGEVSASGCDFHLVKSVIEYRQPVLFDQEIDVCVRTARIGRTSFTVGYEIHAAGEDNLFASGEAVMVCADLATHKPVPAPVKMIECMRSFEGRNLATT